MLHTRGLDESMPRAEKTPRGPYFRDSSSEDTAALEIPLVRQTSNDKRKPSNLTCEHALRLTPVDGIDDTATAGTRNL